MVAANAAAAAAATAAADLAVKSTIDRKNAELSDLSWHYEKEVNSLEHELNSAKLDNSDLKSELVYFLLK